MAASASSSAEPEEDAARVTARIRIGISGWRYAPWRGVYYPKGLRQADELAFAAGQFSTIEINGSFYSLQTSTLYRAWHAATPPDFVFAVKGSRYITHMLRLRGAERALANFFASGVLCLGKKLGPFLWQLPPTLPFDERLEPFLASLPRDTAEARELARGHDERVREPDLGDGAPRKLRHAVEIRHPSFCVPSFAALLRRYGVAFVIADTAGHFPYSEDVTADFVYVRLHGDEELYRSGYSAGAIAHWARRVRAFGAGREPVDPVRIGGPAPLRRSGRDVYVYFDNDVKVHAPFDALALAKSAARVRSVPARAGRRVR
jgi:uncharacterized protein YecE (DUF72 family)